MPSCQAREVVERPFPVFTHFRLFIPLQVEIEGLQASYFGLSNAALQRGAPESLEEENPRRLKD